METDRWCVLLSDAWEMCRGGGCHGNGRSLLSGGWRALTVHSGGCELLRDSVPTSTVERRSGRSGAGKGKTQAPWATGPQGGGDGPTR